MTPRKRAERSSLQDLTKEYLLRHIQKKPDRAASFRRILDDFQADRSDRKWIKEILDQLVRDRELVHHKGNRYEAPRKEVLVYGRISLHRDGYGFVILDDRLPGIESDVFVAPTLTASAMHGDRVGIVITLKKPGGRAEGKVVRVEKRARDTIIGQLRFDGEVFFVSPADEKLPPKILVVDAASEHKDKMVEVELTRFPSDTHWPAGKVVSVIGFIDDPNVETNVIIRKYGLPVEFPQAVIGETASLQDELREEDFANRDDFRDRSIVTIDPATARDFDDAIDVKETAGGGFRLGVHIADVSHFVPVDSATDREGRLRGTSVYFPDRVVPMLPEKISNQLCSLNPYVDRLAMSVILDIAPDGAIKGHSFHESVIRSSERFTYEQVQQILDGNGSLRSRYRKFVADLGVLERLARLLREKRRERGTIDFDLPEPELTFDANGLIEGISKAERYFSHKMIEEFMIAANEAVARTLESEIHATIFRVHEPPDPSRIEQLSAVLAGLGLKFHPRSLRPAQFQKFLNSMAGRPDERMVSYLMLRSFKQAVYAVENRGHFGLASECYTHFTSPIRRYPDLIIHRILKVHIGGKRQRRHSMAQLGAIASESSERERTADAAERELYNWKRMILLEEHIGDTFEALIISVSPHGMTVELIDQFIEGFIPVGEIEDDYYDFEPPTRTLVGRGTRNRYSLGRKITVQVARVDKLLGRAYFLPVLAIKKGRR